MPRLLSKLTGHQAPCGSRTTGGACVTAASQFIDAELRDATLEAATAEGIAIFKKLAAGE